MRYGSVRASVFVAPRTCSRAPGARGSAHRGPRPRRPACRSAAGVPGRAGTRPRPEAGRPAPGSGGRAPHPGRVTGAQGRLFFSVPVQPKSEKLKATGGSGACGRRQSTRSTRTSTLRPIRPAQPSGPSGQRRDALVDGLDDRQRIGERAQVVERFRPERVVQPSARLSGLPEASPPGGGPDARCAAATPAPAKTRTSCTSHRSFTLPRTALPTDEPPLRHREAVRPHPSSSPPPSQP